MFGDRCGFGLFLVARRGEVGAAPSPRPPPPVVAARPRPRPRPRSRAIAQAFNKHKCGFPQITPNVDTKASWTGERAHKTWKSWICVAGSPIEQWSPESPDLMPEKTLQRSNQFMILEREGGREIKFRVVKMRCIK